jgi:hypothetical protein
MDCDMRRNRTRAIYGTEGRRGVLKRYPHFFESLMGISTFGVPGKSNLGIRFLRKDLLNAGGKSLFAKSVKGFFEGHVEASRLVVLKVNADRSDRWRCIQ